MDSLLATYASSDDEEAPAPEPSKPEPPPPSIPRATSLFSSLPKPQSTPLFSSLPQPKASSSSSPSVIPNQPNPGIDDNFPELPNPPSSKLFSSLSQPKESQNPSHLPASTNNPPRRVIQIRPPINPIFSKRSEIDEDDDDEDEKQKKRRRQSESAAQTSTVLSFLSSMPAARVSSALGALPSASSGRRSIIIETESSAPSSGDFLGGINQVSVDQNGESYNSLSNYGSAIDQNGVSQVNSSAPSYGGYLGENNSQVAVDQNSGGNYGSYVDQSGGSYAYYDNNYGNYQMGFDQSASGGESLIYGGYESYGNYGQDGNNGSDLVETEVKVLGKRGKAEIPAEIVEVKQDELMKNRPREDQMKLTGIAFGPSYQPASSKGKPSKLHKRKHQIGSLYFDMKQKEIELSERRSRGLLTKAQTQGKYGW